MLYKVLQLTCVGDDKGEVEELTVNGLAGLVVSEARVITIAGESREDCCRARRGEVAL